MKWFKKVGLSFFRAQQNLSFAFSFHEETRFVKKTDGRIPSRISKWSHSKNFNVTSLSFFESPDTFDSRYASKKLFASWTSGMSNWRTMIVLWYWRAVTQREEQATSQLSVGHCKELNKNRIRDLQASEQAGCHFTIKIEVPHRKYQELKQVMLSKKQ